MVFAHYSKRLHMSRIFNDILGMFDYWPDVNSVLLIYAWVFPVRYLKVNFSHQFLIIFTSRRALFLYILCSIPGGR